MSLSIHPTTIIEEGAIIGRNVKIGPYCLIGPNVQIQDNSILHSHIVVNGHTKIGSAVEIFPFATVGLVPQDLKYKGEDTMVEIGDFTRIRENVTIHAGTAKGIGKTVIGSRCLLMVGVHIAHDCVIGEEVIIANYANLAGHVEVGKKAVLGGLSGFHQFVKIGEYAIVGGGSIVDSDVVPYGHVLGERARLAGLNLVGMKRNNVDREQIATLKLVFDYIFHNKSKEIPIEERARIIQQQYTSNTRISTFCSFIIENEKRGLCMPDRKK